MTSHRHLSILAGVVLLGCAAVKTTPADPAKPAVKRVTFTPKVVFLTWGDLNFDRNEAVVRRYLAVLRSVQSPCVPGARTAREKRDGLPGSGKCPAEDPLLRDKTPVEVLIDSIPEGIDITGGKIRTVEGISLVGRASFVVPYDYTPTRRGALIANDENLGFAMKADIVDELKHLARAASANLVVLSFVNETTDKAGGAAALLFQVDLSAIDTDKSRRSKVPVEI